MNKYLAVIILAVVCLCPARGACADEERKAIDISGASEELFDYPVRIELANSGNIRFTAGDGSTPLAYYIEEKGDVSETSPFSFWVKVPHIPKEGTKIYVYYNAVIASAAKQSRNDNNDGNKVFPFFEGFDSQALDETKWQLRPELDKVCNLKDGYLELKSCSIISRSFKMKKGILEFKARAEKNAAVQAIARGVINRFGNPSEQMVYSSGYHGAEHTIAVNDVAKLNIANPIQPDTDYVYKVIVNDEGLTFERYSGDYEKQAEIRFLDTYTLEEGYIGLKSSAGRVYFDWVRARPYVEVEPEIKPSSFLPNEKG